MFGLIKGLAGTANLWFMFGLFAVGSAMGTAGGWTVGTWKERASHLSDWQGIAGDKDKSLKETQDARAADHSAWLAAVAAVGEKDDLTASEADAILKKLGVMTNAIHSVKVQTTLLSLGSCNFGPDFDWLRYSAWRAATGHPSAVDSGSQTDSLDVNRHTAPRAATANPNQGADAGTTGEGGR